MSSDFPKIVIMFFLKSTSSDKYSSYFPEIDKICPTSMTNNKNFNKYNEKL